MPLFFGYNIVESYLRRQVNEMTAHAPKTQWVWNLEEADIDDPTGEIRRLGKQVNDVIAISLLVVF